MERKLLTASSPFGAVRDGQFTMPRFVDVDLTSARTEQTAIEIPIAGNVLYCDANPSDGNCIIEFNDVGRDSGTDTPFYVSPGFIANVPYTRIRVYNAAQPGKKVRIVYGVDIPFQPGSVAQVGVTVNGVVSINDTISSACRSDFLSQSSTLAFVSTQIVAPAANTQGLTVKMAAITSSSAGGSGVTRAAIFAAPAAPASFSVNPGICLGLIQANSGSVNSFVDANLSRFVPAGWGIYACDISITAAGSFICEVAYQ